MDLGPAMLVADVGTSGKGFEIMLSGDPSGQICGVCTVRVEVILHTWLLAELVSIIVTCTSM